jgi:D-alanyl-D-alanine carboxypeptidase (penicillin-binding protein 5/6)
VDENRQKKVNLIFKLSACTLSLSAIMLALSLIKTVPLPQRVYRPEVESASTQQPPIPINSENLPAPIISAKSFIVKDADSGTVLTSQNENEKLFPASTTKILTALVALEEYRLEDVVTIGHLVGSNLKPTFVTGEKITVENLLYALLVESNNDAAYALADYNPAGRNDFIRLMNEKVKELGLTNTHFVNPAGFDDPGQYTSASDLALIGAFAMSHPVFARIVGTEASEVFSADQSTQHSLVNINQLLGSLPGVRGIKTGYTEAAGENLVTDVVRDDHEIIAVVLGSKNRFEDTQALVNWAYSNFTWR